MLDPKQIEIQKLDEVRKLLITYWEHTIDAGNELDQIYDLITARIIELKGRDKKTKL